jgi:hypothetical protein
MIETMEAVEIEKQRHHSTRMEALARLATLEVYSCLQALPYLANSAIYVAMNFLCWRWSIVFTPCHIS